MTLFSISRLRFHVESPIWLKAREHGGKRRKDSDRVASSYRKASGRPDGQVERLTEALNNPEDRNEAAEAIRTLVEKITLRPGPNRGQIDATLHGELGTVLGWIEAQGIGKTAKTTPAALAPGVSVSVVAGIGFEPIIFRL